MPKLIRNTVKVALVLLVLGSGAYVVIQVSQHGFSARDKPSRLEKYLARHARKIATPTGAKQSKSPYPVTPESMAAARAHFVEHCSSCHGLDGRGDTTIGRNLYPKVPDMTDAETQQLSDGELYYIISNGVRFTGMPAWGSEDSPKSIWELVAFVRRLPQLSPEDLRTMRELAGGTSSEEKAEVKKPHSHSSGAGSHRD